MLNVTTNIDETFDFLTQAGETADGAGLGLREALELISAGTSVGPVNFDPLLSGSIFDLSSGLSLLVSTQDIEINGDIDGDLTPDVMVQQ